MNFVGNLIYLSNNDMTTFLNSFVSVNYPSMSIITYSTLSNCEYRTSVIKRSFYFVIIIPINFFVLITDVT